MLKAFARFVNNNQGPLFAAEGENVVEAGQKLCLQLDGWHGLVEIEIHDGDLLTFGATAEVDIVRSVFGSGR